MALLSVLQSDCVMVDQPPQKKFNKGHIYDQIVQRLIKLEVLKEILKLI